jgi:hypothetical protein
MAFLLLLLTGSDVFMDAVNRKLSMQLMVRFHHNLLNLQIEAASVSDGKQFILITPQDMGAVKATGPNIRVHRYLSIAMLLTLRMRDPERGQGVIETS